MDNTSLRLSAGSVLELSEGVASRRTILGNILNVGEVDGWDEAGGVAGIGDLGVELVDLLEGETLGLVDEEVDEGCADDTESTPDEEDLGAHVGVTWAVVDHVWGDVGDDEVEEPVGGGGHGKTLGSGLEGEGFTGDDPGAWTPGAGEEEDVEADECDEALGGDLGAWEGGTD